VVVVVVVVVMEVSEVEDARTVMDGLIPWNGNAGGRGRMQEARHASGLAFAKPARISP
jgi:hypothetical protein